MYPVSQAFIDAVSSGNYQIATAVKVTGPLGSPTLLSNISLMSGAGNATITIDRNASQRRTCTLTLVDTVPSTLIPSSYTSPITPFGNEIVPYFGVTYPNGTQELVPMGVFTIATVEVQDSSTDLVINVQGYDRSYAISQLSFLNPYTVPAGQSIVASIEAVITSVAPGIVFNISPVGDATLPSDGNWDQGDNAWDVATTLANYIGYELYFDVNGVCVGTPILNPTQLPTVWSFNADAEGSAMSQLTRTLTQEGINNVFWMAAAGSGNDPPFQAEAADTNPSSPTYIDGPLGDRPIFYSSSLIVDNQTAQNAADLLQLQSQGAIDEIDIIALPFPMFDVDDVVYAQDTRAGVTGGNYVMDSAQTSLSHDGTTEIVGRAVPS